MIQVRASGGGGLPADWTEEVTATAFENTAVGDAIEYRMYPGSGVFNGSVQSLATGNIKFSANGLYSVHVPSSNANSAVIRKYVAGLWTTVFTTPTFYGSVGALEISSDGKYVFVGSTTGVSSPALFVYKTSDGTNYSQLTILYPWCHHITCMKLTPDNTYLAVGVYTVENNGCPCMYMYKRTGDTFAEIGIASIPIASSDDDTPCLNIDCDNNGIYWIFSYSYEGSNYYCVGLIKRTADAFTVIKSETSIYRATYGGTSSVAMAPNGTRFSHSVSGNPYLYIYSLVNDIVTRLSTPDVIPPADIASNNSFGVNAIQYSPDGLYLYVLTGVSPYFIAYNVTAGVYTKRANPSALPPSGVSRLTVTPDGKSIYISSTSLFMYTTGVGAFIIPLRSLINSRYLQPNVYGYFGVGMAKTAAAAGTQCTATMLRKINNAGA